MRLRLSAAEAVQTAQHLIFGEAGVPAATAATPLRLASTSGFTPAAPQQVRGASSRSSRSRTADSCAAGDGGDTTGERSLLCIVCYTSHCHAPASPLALHTSASRGRPWAQQLSTAPDILPLRRHDELHAHRRGVIPPPRHDGGALGPRGVVSTSDADTSALLRRA